MEETKIIYHIDDEETPYLIKLSIHTDKVTLGDLKNALNRPTHKYFFKSMDDDFGIVKEEIFDDDAHLPCFNGRVVSWLVTSESSTSDTQSQGTDHIGDIIGPGLVQQQQQNGGGGSSSNNSISKISRPASNSSNGQSIDQVDSCTETESLLGSAPDVRDNRNAMLNMNIRQVNHRPPPIPPVRPQNRFLNRYPAGIASSIMSSDIETTSFMDSDEDQSQYTTGTDIKVAGGMAGAAGAQHQRRRKRKHRPQPMSRATSFSSITDSTMSLNIITVTLNMDTVNFLGISIVGQSNQGGDGGIYVGSIMKGGAVALDGRIEPGDMILEVNGSLFENMSNDEAVKTLRDAVQQPGPITLVVAKCWDPSPKGFFTVPRQEPVRPIDPSAWVAHTEAFRAPQPDGFTGHPGVVMMNGQHQAYNMRRPGTYPLDSSMLSTVTSSSLSAVRDQCDDLLTVVRAMAEPESGLEIRDRMWLKITIPNAFLGSDLVDWLITKVRGFPERRDARKYACRILKAGYIRHTVNKLTFSEQCYYVFGDLRPSANAAAYHQQQHHRQPMNAASISNQLSSLHLDDIDSVSEADNRDHLGPLPGAASSQYNLGSGHHYNNMKYAPRQYQAPPIASSASGNTYQPIGGSASYLPPPAAGYNHNQNKGYIPPAPYNFTTDTQSYVSMPTSANDSILSSAVKQQNCACVAAAHTYRQFKRLWDNHEKAEALAAAAANGHCPQHQRPDLLDCSTSSSSGSSTSGSNSQQRSVVESGGPSQRVPAPLGHPLANNQKGGPQTMNSDLNCSIGSFKLAMGNIYKPADIIKSMGEL